MNQYLVGIIVVLIVFDILVFAYFRHKDKSLLMKIDNMLNSVKNGNFTEDRFDESMLSAIETKFKHYISSCEVSSQNLNTEKEKIKELISDISHQTKTPIANILLYSQLLKEQDISDENKVYVEELSVQADKLNFLIHALIKTSRLETGVVSLAPKRSEISKMLTNIERQILVKAQHKNIDINIKQTAETAVFDEKWTTEALYNIVDNAVKYTEKDGRIEVSISKYQFFCRIDIRDNGIGIAEDEQSKIFSRFYRSQAVKQEEGIGIGLFLAREIIHSQGGYIKLDSDLNKGSTFSVFLPIQNENLSEV